MLPSILVTGASRGLGLEITKHYLAQGWRVFAAVRSVPCQALQDQAQRYGSMLAPVMLDVTRSSMVAAAADTVGQVSGALDICVNNAAISTTERFGTLETLDFAEAQALYDTNALGPLRVAKAFLPLLRKGVNPAVVNISSEAGQIAANTREREYEYCMSKAALNMATALLSRRLIADGICVLAVHPGWIRTDMGGQDATGDPAQAAAALAAVIEEHRGNPGTHVFYDSQGCRMDW